MVLVLFHVRVQCGFHAGAGRMRAGTMWSGAGAGWQYLVRAAGRVTRTLCGAGAGQQQWPRGGCESEISARADVYGIVLCLLPKVNDTALHVAVLLGWIEHREGRKKSRTKLPRGCIDICFISVRTRSFIKNVTKLQITILVIVVFGNKYNRQTMAYITSYLCCLYSGIYYWDYLRKVQTSVPCKIK